jgi:thiosulfate dehydrogenase (quinone) large subunit
VSVPQPGWVNRVSSPQPGWVMLPLRGFLAVVFLYAGISKIADRTFLDGTAPTSIHSQVLAVKQASPISGLLGPVADHSFAFGLIMAFAEIAVGLGILLGLFTRIAAAGGMLLALSLWLTVSWQANPWYTSADLVYLFAFTPILLGGAAVLSLDAWLADARRRHPGVTEDRTRRAVLAGGAVLLGGLIAGGSALFRTSPAKKPAVAQPSQLLAQAADVPVGGAVQVRDPNSGHQDWVLQLSPGQFTALDATCPHQGCTVNFDSAATGFTCPCHGSRYDATGKLLRGPATRGLTPVPVKLTAGEVRSA